ncbi:unnamed protein product [Sphagnum troendelagicum]|uniref:Uncharacterized protein n=1 Tax=Sphagnum troendelagicum TaxID=128251 RepID=A0ABP0TRS3_9BRYO
MFSRLTRKQSPNSQRCSQQREQEENTDRYHEEKSIAHLVRDSGCQLVAAPDPIANASRLECILELQVSWRWETECLLPEVLAQFPREDVVEEETLADVVVREEGYIILTDVGML